MDDKPSDWIKIDGMPTAHVRRGSVSFVQMEHKTVEVKPRTTYPPQSSQMIQHHWIKIISNGATVRVLIGGNDWLDKLRKLQADLGIDPNKE